MLLYFFGTHQRVFKLQLAPEANYFHTTSVISRG